MSKILGQKGIENNEQERLSPWDNEYKVSNNNQIYKPLNNMLQQFLNDYSIKTVLDYGCGEGIYSYLMGENGYNVIGIDISTIAIEKAISYNHKVENCRFICNNHIPDSLPNNFFDSVVMLNSYHCLTRKERIDTLIQVNRVLKKNGYLFASILSIEDESYPRKDWEEIDINTFKDDNGKIFHFFSLDEVLQELKDFEILDNKMLKNIHPETGRKSALFVITARRKK